MSATITRIATTGAGALLALGLLATAPPAGAADSGHGTNHETSACFTATGHTQGRSHSDPDGMSNGGADKPGCTGGFDADRDGNNGCGNDADREDDNNGHCGGPKPERVGDQRAAKTEVEAESQDHRGDCHDKAATAAVVGDSAKKCACPVGSEGSAVAPATVSAAAAGREAAGSAVTSPDVAATPGTDTAVAATTTPDTQVLGESITRPSALARTGAGVGGLALLGGLLCGGGRLTLLARRLLRIG